MKRKDESTQDDPVQTIRMPLCYGCGVALTAPGYCDACLKQTELDLQALATSPQRHAGRILVNGYWIHPSCAPDHVKARLEHKLTPEQEADLAREHAEVRARMKRTGVGGSVLS